MALRTKNGDSFTEIKTEKQWLNFFSDDIGLPATEATQCANTFLVKTLSGEDVIDLLATAEIKDNNIFDITMGQLTKTKRWLKNAQLCCSVNTPDLNNRSNNSIAAGPKIPRPNITMDIGQIEFDQFIFEWEVYKNHYGISGNQLASHLLYSCSPEVRQRVRIEHPDFIQNSYSEEQLITIISNIVLSKTSEIVHIKEFYDIIQNDNESCVEFLGRLEAKASCCNFKCEKCNQVTSNTSIMERFIIGLKNKLIQTAILKTESVTPRTSLKKLLYEALTLEKSIKEQA